MEPEELVVATAELGGVETVAFRWLPDGEPRALIHILHGWAEHAMRYDRPARAFAEAGFAVYADDHMGHGETGKRSGTLGNLGPRGMDGVLDAVHAVTRHARAQHPGAPAFVLGHSWGSFLLQRYLRRWPDELAGALLTGTTYRDPAATPASTETRRDPNEAFAPARTAYDWLSRDEAEVDKYVADPLCGFEIMQGSPTARAASSPSVPLSPSLPILVFNGAADPIGGEEGGRALADHYRSLGATDVSCRSYPGARHELFNETNRDEVVADVLAWLDDHVA